MTLGPIRRPKNEPQLARENSVSVWFTIPLNKTLFFFFFSSAQVRLHGSLYNECENCNKYQFKTKHDIKSYCKRIYLLALLSIALRRHVTPKETNGLRRVQSCATRPPRSTRRSDKQGGSGKPIRTLKRLYAARRFVPIFVFALSRWSRHRGNKGRTELYTTNRQERMNVFNEASLRTKPQQRGSSSEW